MASKSVAQIIEEIHGSVNEVGSKIAQIENLDDSQKIFVLELLKKQFDEIGGYVLASGIPTSVPPGGNAPDSSFKCPHCDNYIRISRLSI